jgi:hypothetical protein
MDEPLKKSITPVERGQRAKTRRTPAKLRAKPERPAPAEPAAAARISLAPEAKSLMPSAALIGMGLLLESELLVGIALGTGIVIVSRWLPQAVGDTVQPIVNTTVKACYSAAAKTSEMLGEAAQRVESIITRQAPAEEKAAATPEGEPEAQEGRPQA